MTANLTTKRAGDLVAGDRYVLAITDADNPGAFRTVAAVEPAPLRLRPDAIVVHHRESEWKRSLSADRLVVVAPAPRTVDRLALDAIVLPTPKPAREHHATVALFGSAVSA